MQDFNKKLTAALAGNTPALEQLEDVIQNQTLWANQIQIIKDEISPEKKSAPSYAIALYLIGFLYYKGCAVTQDYHNAFQYWKKASDLHCAKASCAIGYMYEYGIGINLNTDKAISYYKKAIALGYNNAFNNLGLCYLNRSAIKLHKVLAFQCFQKSAMHGDGNGMYHLARMYKNGNGTEVNLARSLEWYTKSASLGTLKAMEFLSIFYFFKQPPIELGIKQILEWCQKITQQTNSVYSRVILILSYYKGWGVEQDKVQAAKLAWEMLLTLRHSRDKIKKNVTALCDAILTDDTASLILIYYAAMMYSKLPSPLYKGEYLTLLIQECPEEYFELLAQDALLTLKQKVIYVEFYLGLCPKQIFATQTSIDFMGQYLYEKASQALIADQKNLAIEYFKKIPKKAVIYGDACYELAMCDFPTDQKSITINQFERIRPFLELGIQEAEDENCKILYFYSVITLLLPEADAICYAEDIFNFDDLSQQYQTLLAIQTNQSNVATPGYQLENKNNFFYSIKSDLIGTATQCYHTIKSLVF